MTKLKAFLAAALVCVIAAGCAEMPDSLKESAAPESEASEAVTVPQPSATAEQTEAEFQPAERGDMNVIRSQLDYDLQKTYKNITVEWARAGEGSVMPTYDVRTARGEDFDIYSHAEYLFGGRLDVRDEKYWTHENIGDPMYKDYPVSDEPELLPDGNVLNLNCLTFATDAFREDAKRDMWLGFVSNTKGEIWGSKTGSRAPDGTYYHDSFDTAARYDLDREAPPEGLSYTMYGGEEWSVGDAIKFVEGFYNSEIAPSDPQAYTYFAKTLFVKSLPGDTFGYLFVMQKRDEAGNFFDVDRHYLTDMEAIESGDPFMISSGNMCWCSQKETPARYTKGHSVEYTLETDSGDSLLTLGAAADILSEKLAPNINLNLSAELNYVTVCKSYPYYSVWEYPTYYEYLALTDCELEIKPYWCFRPVGSSSFDGDGAEIYFVDAVSGEVVAMFYGEVQRR